MLNKLRSSCDLPFNRDAAHKFIPWIIGLMIFLALNALVGTNMLATYVSQWEKSFSEGFTIEIPRYFSSEENGLSLANQQDEILKKLENVSGVESVQVIPKTYLSPFVDPFADSQENFLLFDVKVRQDFSVDTYKVKQLLNGYGEAKIRDHRQWRQSSLNFAYSAIFIGILMASFIGLAAVATIAFVARTGLEVHSRTIEILHLVGARHKYIATQFQNYVLQLARQGSIIGMALFLISCCTIATFLGIQDTFGYLKNCSFIDLALIIGLTPFIGVLLTVLSARFTVLSTLAKTNTW